MQQKLNFCFEQANPHTLVILNKCDRVIQKIAQYDNLNFIWIDRELTQSTLKSIHHISTKLGIVVIFYSDVQQSLSKVNQQSQQFFILICSPDLIDSVKKFIRKPNIIKVICYPLQDKPICKKDFYLGIRNQQSLLQQMKINKYRNFQYKQLTCFITTQKNIESSNLQIKTMFTMLNQNITTFVRIQIVDQLQIVFNKLEDISQQLGYYKQISSAFLDQLRNGVLPLERAIYWYTIQSPIYKLVNNILRSSNHPFQLFYIQPFFKDLFCSIHKLYQIQQDLYNIQQFVCYRGDSISEKQIQYFQNNVGQIVQNLNFLSTSLKKQTGKMFLRNVLYIIHVKNNKRVKEGDYGFAFLSQYSQYHQEQQILFNPLNSFKIMAVSRQKKEQNFFEIVLEYGELARISFKQIKQLNQQQKWMKQLHQSQTQKKKLMKLQGHALLFPSHSLQGSIQYWSKFLQIAKQNTQKSYAIYYLAQIYQNECKYSEALSYLAYGINLQKNKKRYCYYLYNLANLHFLQNKYHKAIMLFRQCQQILHKQSQSFGLFYAQILNNIAACYCQLQEFKQAHVVILQCEGLINANNYKAYNIYNHLIFNLANIHIRKFEYKQALLLLNSVKQFISRTLGEIHPKFQAVLFAKAFIYRQLKNYDYSLSLLKKGAKIIKCIFGKYHPNYIKNLNQIGRIYLHLKKIKIALKIFLECRKILRNCQNVSKMDFQINKMNIQMCQSSIYQIRNGRNTNIVFFDFQSL